MGSPRAELLKDIFQAAIDLPPEERGRLLEARCAGDPELRAEVEILLEHDLLRARSFLQSPVAGLVAGLDALGPGAVIDGRYRIEETLGHGGMGVVYRAQQLGPLRREVALKVIKPGMDSQQVIARFEVERQALALMEHAGIARVFDAGTTEAGRPYFAMELVRGEALTEHCDRRSSSVGERLALFVAVCEAVQHAHQKGIIHRDIKPSNVLVTVDESTGATTPKVIDFGIAKATGAALADAPLATIQRQLLGTPAYMSPEQAALSPDIDTRSDIYALGVLLYELLTGLPPFAPATPEGAAWSAIQRLIRDVEPPRPSTRVRRLSLEAAAPQAHMIARRRGTDLVALGRRLRGDLDWIVMKALEKDRARRYPTAGDLAQDIARHLRHEPVSAGPPSAAYRLRKLARRRRGPLAAAAIVCLLIIAFGIAMYLKSEEALRQRARADESATSLARELRLRNVQSGRLLGQQGAMGPAEDALWREHLRTPDAPLTHWALWELHARSPRLATIRTHRLARTEFSPDGTLFATGGGDGALSLWDAQARRVIASIPGHLRDVTSVAFTPDGRTLASAALDGKVILTDVPERATRLRIDAHETGANSVTFNHEGTILASGGEDRLVKAWDPVTGDLLATLAGHEARVTCMRFGPDGSLLASTGGDGSIRLWRVGAWSEEAVLRGHEGIVGSLAFTADGRHLYSGGLDRVIRVWDVERRTTVQTLHSANGSIRALLLSADGRTLVSGGWWKIDLWSLPEGALRRSFPITTPVRGLSASPDGRILISGSGADVAELAERAPGELLVWDCSGRAEKLRLAGHRSWASACISADGRLVATGDAAGVLRLWDARSGALRGAAPAHAGRILALDFHPSGALVATGGADQTLRLWDADSLALVRTIRDHDNASAAALRFSPDGKLLALPRRRPPGDAAGAVQVEILDVQSGAVRAALAPSAHQIIGVAFSPDSSMLAVGARDGRIRLHSTAGGLLRTFAGSGLPWGLEFSLDGTRVVAGTRGETVDVFDIGTGRHEILTGHGAVVYDVAVRPGDPALVASGSGDGTVKLWDLTDRCEVASLTPIDGFEVSTVAWSADGRLLVVAGRSDAVIVYDMTYYDRHIAGNVEHQIERLGPELGGTMRAEELRAWAREVLARPWPLLAEAAPP
jgi:WD40 repeat protein/RIO-like serine/threonine protein kinase